MHSRASFVTPIVVAGRPLAGLVHALRRLGDLSREAPEVDALLAGLSVPLGPLRPRVAFPRVGYARTLVYRDARFELLVLGWAAGGAAPVHDHDGQDCWFLPLAGAFDLDDYRLDGARADGAGGRARLWRWRSRRLHAGAVDHRDEHQAVHAVTAVGAAALSLHLYARPLDRCRVFDRRRGRWGWVALGYDARAPELAE